MLVVKDLLPINAFSRPGLKLAPLKAIIIHWVGKSKQTARAVKEYFESLNLQNPTDAIPDLYASAHYSIDGTMILQMIPDDEVAYHAGGWTYTQKAESLFGADGVSNKPLYGSTPNFYTIGIEVNHIDDEGQFSRDTLESTIKLTAKLCNEYSLNPVNSVLRHYDLTGKLCPKWFVLHEYAWESFLDSVCDKMEALHALG